jgi:hypothetical protein
MSTITTIRDENRLLVSAADLFASMQRKEASGEERDDFRNWLCDRIMSFEMEEGYDFFIYLNSESVREMLKYETAPEELKRFFNNFQQYV